MREQTRGEVKREVGKTNIISPRKIAGPAMPATTVSGVVGRPSLASPADGAKLTQMLVEDLSAIVRTALAEEWPQSVAPQ